MIFLCVLSSAQRFYACARMRKTQFGAIAQSEVRHCLTSSHRQYMVPNLTARPLFSPIYLNRTCANSANSAILMIKMLKMIGIMKKLHLYQKLVRKYEYFFYFILFFIKYIYFFFYFSR